jgi:glycyl-tRNA synthetase beta chain
MAEDLILEIGTEELPPSCTGSGLESLKEQLGKNLGENRIRFEHIYVYSSPRRLTAHVSRISENQDTVVETVMGPPKKIAYDDDGKPGEPAAGFARGIGVGVEELEEIEIEGRGIYLGKNLIKEGKGTADILPDILKNTILSLTFEKQMTWGDYNIKFIRPIRWLLAMMGSKVIDFGIENVRSGNTTFGHRTISPAPIKINSAAEYFQKLKTEGNVIVKQSERRDLIYDQIKNIEEKIWENKYRVLVDEKLLNDVVNLISIPNVLAGSFPEDFLYIPSDILVEAIKYHQKYFPVIDTGGNITTQFLIVQNGLKDKGGDIRRGNERVLKARLSDASFFYEQDKKNDFSYWGDKLKGVIFYSGLGSMHEKQQRLKYVCNYLAEKINGRDNEKLKGYLAGASTMCKCDLVTSMVVEFPELQGIVGREYARERGYEEPVSEAIFEHYLPGFAEDSLPVTETGRILSLADRIDTVTGMFIVGNIPSGSEDPFALRRRASGIVRSVIAGDYDIDLGDLIGFCIKLYREAGSQLKADESTAVINVFMFITERLRFMMAKDRRRMDVLDAVLGSGCRSILDIDLRCKAVEDYILKGDIKSIVWPMSRSQNIISGRETGDVEPGLFREEHEKDLYMYLSRVSDRINMLIDKKDYQKTLSELKNFGKTVDTFFDEVLVMDKDEKIRNNRLSLLKKVVDLYRKLADFSLVIVENEGV